MDSRLAKNVWDRYVYRSDGPKFQSVVQMFKKVSDFFSQKKSQNV